MGGEGHSHFTYLVISWRSRHPTVVSPLTCPIKRGGNENRGKEAKNRGDKKEEKNSVCKTISRITMTT